MKTATGVHPSHSPTQLRHASRDPLHRVITQNEMEDTLDNLAKECPKSMEVLHKALIKALHNVESKLRQLESVFYCGLQCKAYLASLTPIFCDVMDKFQVTFLHASWQIRDVVRRHDNSSGDQFGVDRCNFVAFKEFGDKLNELFPCHFDEVISDIRKIVEFLDKYCMSFFSGKPDPLVEIATHYDEVKQSLMTLVEERMAHIQQMGVDFKDKGITQKVLSTPVNQMGRKAGCSYLPLLLCYPEACSDIRNSCEDIAKWIQSDRHYPEMVRNDITQLQQSRLLQVQQVRKAREKNVLTSHRHKALQKEFAQMEDKVTKLSASQQAIEEDISQMTSHVNEIKLDLNLRVQDVEELKERAQSAGGTSSDCSGEQLVERLQLAQGEVANLRFQTYLINKQVDASCARLQLISDKEDALQSLREEVLRYGRMAQVSRTEVVLAVREMDNIEQCLDQLKDVYRKRTCPNITSKIFEGMPIVRLAHTRQIASPQLRKGETREAASKLKPEAMERVCRLVARSIGSDWPKLYRALSFFPARGETTLDADIDVISKTHYRAAAEVAAAEALTRWRRVHTRACVADVTRALGALGRRALVDKVARVLRPRTGADRKFPRPQLRVRQAVARFMMLKRMGMTLPFAQPEQARRNTLMDHSAMFALINAQRQRAQLDRKNAQAGQSEAALGVVN